jgi:hypothetical protein
VAKRGSNKDRSVEQENWVAKVYGGKRSPSSGAADTDQGDVRLVEEGTLIECKTTGGPGDKPKGGRLLTEFEKIADEAFSEAREPAMCLRFWRPDSVLSDRDGYVNLTVRLTLDDVERSKLVHAFLALAPYPAKAAGSENGTVY